eukprot:s3271_g5.t1
MGLKMFEEHSVWEVAFETECQVQAVRSILSAVLERWSRTRLDQRLRRSHQHRLQCCGQTLLPCAVRFYHQDTFITLRLTELRVLKVIALLQSHSIASRRSAGLPRRCQCRL